MAGSDGCRAGVAGGEDGGETGREGGGGAGAATGAAHRVHTQRDAGIPRTRQSLNLDIAMGLQ